MPAPPPSGRTEKVLDYLQRGEYASAGMAEWLKGESPYDNIFEAAWKGLSGQRRMNYIELTGNVALGLVAGIALDPITWLPAGAITKGIKATRIPKMLALASIKTANKFPQYAGLVRAGRLMASKFKGGALSSMMYLEHLDESKDVLKLYNVGDDIVRDIGEGVVSRGRGYINAIRGNGMLRELTDMGYDNKAIVGLATGKLGLDDIAGGLHSTQYKRLQEILKVRDATKNISDLNKISRLAKIAEGKTIEYRLGIMDDALTKARRLHKLGDKAQYNITDLIEGAKVVPGEGVWKLSDDTITAFKNMGVSDDFINATIKSVDDIPIPGVGKRMGIRGVTGDVGLQDMASRVGKTINAMDKPLVSEMPEFTTLLEKALTNIDPELAGLGKRYGYIYGQLTAEAQKLGMLPREMMTKFANTIGLSHLPHSSIGANLEVLAERGAIIRKTFLGRVDETVKSFKQSLEAKGVAPDIVNAQTENFMASLQKIANSTLKDALEGTDPLLKFTKEAARLSKSSPEVAQAMRVFQKNIDELTKFRKVMGTINEINTLAGKKVFETNFAELMFEYEMRIKTAMHMHDFVEQTSRIMPDMMKTWKAGQKIPEGFVKYSDPLLGDFLVKGKHRDTVDLLMGITNGRGGDWQKFLKSFDKHTGIWKYTTLIPFPKFHLRNYMSEMMLGALGGMPIAHPEYAKAAKLWTAARKGDKTAMKAYAELAGKRVVGSGFLQAEMGAAGKLVGTDIISKAKRVPGVGHYLRGMEKIGTFAEDVPRIAMYNYGKRKGAAWLAKKGFKGKDAAVKYVRKFHPVYDEFTQFEQKVMRRIFPFYSWSRFNLPLHAEMFVHNPRHYVALDKVRRGATEALGGELPEGFTPEWIKHGAAIGISARPGERRYVVSKGWHPAADLLDFITADSAKHKVVSMLHPLKAIPEAMWGRDTFRGRKLPAVPGEKVKMFGLRIDPKAAHLLNTFRAIKEINRFWFTSDDPYLDRAIYALVGRNYVVNIKKAKAQTYYYVTNELIAGDEGLDRGIARAKREGDMKTVRKLKRQKRDLEKSVARYKP